MHTFHTHQVQQGSEAWRALRAKHYTASEAPVMLGLSPYASRSDLVKEKALGIERDTDAGTQQRFNQGHDAEAAARPIAERIIGEELYPVTCSAEIDGLPLLASLDGLMLDGAVVWEHKLWSNALAAQIEAKEIDPHYAVQIEQQMMVTGAARALFMCSDGTEERCAWMWYTPKGNWRETILAGWKLFAEDMANYQPVEVLPAAVAAPIEDLPALNIEISGRVLSTNLTAWQDIVKARIQAINTDLQNDNDFATAEKTVKFLEDREKMLTLVKSQAQSQVADIDTLFRTIDAIAAEMRAKRLDLDKLVKNRKESIRGEILREGQQAYSAHLGGLNKRIGKPYMPMTLPVDFAGAMRGKKTVKSLRDSVDAEVARAKLAANEIADRIEINMREMYAAADACGMSSAVLFPDINSIVLKAPDDLVALLKSRIADHKAAEEKRLEAERERIRQEEAAKAAQAPTNRPAQQIAVRSRGQPQAPAVAATRRPDDEEIVAVLAQHYGVSGTVIVGWLSETTWSNPSSLITAEVA